jgi:IS5 family transposase
VESRRCLGKIVSLFEPHSEIIRKGKASKPTEFGKLVQVQEAENQIITHYDVFDQRPSDRDLLLGAVETHERVLGRVPYLADRGRGLLFAGARAGGRRQGREVGGGAESQYKKCRAEKEGTQPLVQERAALAHGM